ncbi:phage holin family protein [Cytophagaceae bacterium ABcell3]|nr:phage holin family protein [Cytophagaceae bacterium ABcell3]
MNFLISLVILSIFVLGVSAILPGVTVTGFWSALALVLVLSLLNLFIKPILVFLTIPVTVFTLGLFLLVINGFIVMLAAYLVPGFEVVNFWWALLFSLGISFINSLLYK